MKNFALLGAAGYIAPRHLQAIKDTGNTLVAACDPHDSVGILDRYFPATSFFTEYERFDRHLELLKRKTESERVNYLTICSPNFLHDAHIRLALRIGADAICEKPLVLNPWNLDLLQKYEEETGSHVYTVLQLRVHPALIKLREEIKAKQLASKTKSIVNLTYITSRGVWYHHSWKGEIPKSGGIGTNIGVHLFDLLLWLFGEVESSEVHTMTRAKLSGTIELKHANVKWLLSLDSNDLPKGLFETGKSTYRSIEVDGEEVQFSEGFTDLHTRVYEETLAGRGFGISDAYNSITLVHGIREATVTPARW